MKAAGRAIVTAVALLSLGACGFDEQTNQQYQAAVGANHRGPIDVLNTMLVANDDKTATLSASFVNHSTSEQSLSAVTMTTLAGADLPVRSTKSLVPLPKDSAATVGRVTDAGSFRVTSGAIAGRYVKVTLSFTGSPAITIEAPIVGRTPVYDSIAGATTASHHGKIDVLDAAFVKNKDGSTTLSATVVNHLDGDPQEIREVDLTPAGHIFDYNDRYLALFFDRAKSRHHRFAVGKASSVGGVSDDVQIRLDSGAVVGSYVRMKVYFDSYDAFSDRDNEVRMTIPVVARTPSDDSVVGKDGNPYIHVEDGKIVVIPGQRKAYVDGEVISTVTDIAYTVPTAVDSDGNPVKYRHQTATGGPYGLFADQKKPFRIGGAPYIEGPGDADYFDAKDVRIGEKITVTIPFQSGDVKAVFTVVAG
jgi:hypothetical protein